MLRTSRMPQLSRKLSALRETFQIPEDLRLVIDIDPMSLS